MTKIRIWEMYIGNPEIHKNGSGTKLFITFLGLRFFDMRRERHNFFLCWLFHLNPTMCSTFRRPKLVLPQQAPKINLPPSKSETQLQLAQPMRGARSTQSCLASPKSESQLTDFFSNPQILSQCFWAWCHFLSGVFIVTSLIVTSTLRASVNTCTQLTHALSERFSA